MLDAKRIELKFIFPDHAYLLFRYWTSNHILIQSTVTVVSNGNALLEEVVEESKLHSSIRNELSYHELYDYFHKVRESC